MRESIGIAIPTLNAEKHLQRCLGPLLVEGYFTRLLLVDSESSDDTVSVAKYLGVDVHVIKRSEFNHGLTRDLAWNLLDTDIVVYLTQDAYPQTGDFIEMLTRPLIDGIASISYGRQVPREGARVFEYIPRIFNYPAEGHLRGLDTLKQYGAYNFFCSNSCAAYRSEHLKNIGGFGKIVSHEDYFAVARLLGKGHRIAYVAEAVVEHSHDFTIIADFRRYFDAGYARAENPWIRKFIGAEESRGIALTAKLAREIVKTNIFLLPELVVRLLLSWIGFRVGTLGKCLPKSLCMRLSTLRQYWL